MNYTILLTLFLGILASIPSGLPAQEKKILVKFERYGGFAGFHDDLTIYEDFSYVLGTPDPKQHYAGKLSEDDQRRLGEHLKAFGYYFVEKDDGPRARDGMKTRFEFNGFADDDDAKGDVRALNVLMDKIMAAARAGEKTPK